MTKASANVEVFREFLKKVEETGKVEDAHPLLKSVPYI